MVSSTDCRDVDHLRDRVRLYLQVMLVIGLGAHLSDLVGPLLIDDLEYPEMPLSWTALRWATTAVLAASWSFVRFAKPGRVALVATETGVTIGQVLAYIHMGLTYFAGGQASYGPVFTLCGIALLLVVRASLVPSPLGRTVVIGLLSVGSLFVLGREPIATLAPVVIDGMSFVGGAFVVATAVTSHVIYGLRRQVHDARRLGQYELGRKLGEGGMGVVHEATHVMLRRPTAVKLLPVERAGAQTVARFEREVQQTSRLEHPNSVSIYDYGRTPDGQFYYAMELLNGVTLGQLVETDGPLPAARAVHILRQAAHALAEAHAMGLVHRDIKPANIMVCERARVPDTVKVLDFGLVKAIDDPEVGDQITQANTIVGTPRYLAPEAISNPEDVGPAADVYALGAIGFLLVTGREAFTGSSLIEVCSKHLNADPDSPSAVLGAPIDPGFEALIVRCLAKRPEDRPRDGAALAQALEQLDLPGWTVEDAHAWWQEFEKERARVADERTAERAQLTVDVEGRR